MLRERGLRKKEFGQPVVEEVRFELTTYRMLSDHSTPELHPHGCKNRAGEPLARPTGYTRARQRQVYTKVVAALDFYIRPTSDKLMGCALEVRKLGRVAPRA